MRATVISLGVAALLGAVILWAPAPRASADDGEAAGPVRAAFPPLTAPGAVAPSHAASFIRFAPDVVDTAAAPKPAPPVLVGLIGSGPRRIAYVLLGAETVRAGLWDKVGSWRLTAIGPHGVTLSAGRKSLALALYGPRPQPPAPPAASPADAMAAPAPPPPAPLASPMHSHALEPASAPQPRSQVGNRPRYLVGPPGSAPPGYTVLKPGEAPPN
jgi:hypothetical protein